MAGDVSDDQAASWPMTLSIRAFNRYDFSTYPGGTANHKVGSEQELAELLTDLAAAVPEDAPYPLLVRVRVLRGIHDTPFLSREYIAETAADLRAEFIAASMRARDRDRAD